MASVRTNEPLPPRFPAWTVEENKGDPVDTVQQIPLVPFQPLIVCLRILGVELDPAILNESSKCYRYLSWSLGLFFLLSNGLCNLFAGVLGQKKNIYEHNKAVLSSTYNQSLIDGNNSTISSVMSWNLIIDYVNYGVLAFVVHASLFVITRQQKWKLLWDNVQQILQHHNEFKEISKSIRRVTIAGLVIVISVH
jgi:gustatory receptor